MSTSSEAVLISGLGKDEEEEVTSLSFSFSFPFPATGEAAAFLLIRQHKSMSIWERVEGRNRRGQDSDLRKRLKRSKLT